MDVVLRYPPGGAGAANLVYVDLEPFGNRTGHRSGKGLAPWSAGLGVLGDVDAFVTRGQIRPFPGDLDRPDDAAARLVDGLAAGRGRFLLGNLLGLFARDTLELELYQRIADVYGIALGAVDGNNGPVARRGDVGDDFIGFHLHEGVAGLHALSLLYTPFDDLTLGNSFSDIGKLEHVSHWALP